MQRVSRDAWGSARDVAVMVGIADRAIAQRLQSRPHPSLQLE